MAVPTPDRAPVWHNEPATDGFRAGDRSHGHINAGLARLLQDYQRVVFMPGPALLLALLLAAAACLLRGTDRITRWMAAVMSVGGVGLLAMPAVSAGFDWRYLLPAQPLPCRPASSGSESALSALLPRVAQRGAASCPSSQRSSWSA